MWRTWVRTVFCETTSFFSGNYPEYIVGCASGRSSTQGRMWRGSWRAT